MMRRKFDPTLCLVTDRKLSLGRPIPLIVEEAVRGGVTLVQLREKESSTRDFLDLAKEVKGVLTPLGVPLIINDRMDIALAVGAAGIHVGKTDMPVSVLRQHMGPEALIGISVESLEDARAANAMDIDYMGISPVFTTATKRELTTGLGLEGVRAISTLSRVPTLAIGGINIHNIASVLEAGAAGAALISALCGAENPGKASAELRRRAGKTGLRADS